MRPYTLPYLHVEHTHSSDSEAEHYRVGPAAPPLTPRCSTATSVCSSLSLTLFVSRSVGAAQR